MNYKNLTANWMPPLSFSYTNALLERILELTVREVLRVFGVALDDQVLRGAASVSNARGEIMVMAGLSGDLQGFLCLDWGVELAFEIAARRMGVEVHEFNAPMREILEEIGAAVATHFRSKLRNMGWDCALSPPAVISGTEYHFHLKPGYHHVEFALTLHGKPVWVTLSLGDWQPARYGQ